MAQIRLIATDLDGTFLTSDHKPSQKSIEAVKAVRQQGIRVCACSGRNGTELKDLCEMGGLDECAVINNGIIIDIKTGEYKYLRRLNPDAVPDIIALLLRDAREHGNATFTLSGGIETHIWRGCCNERMLGRLAKDNRTGYSAEHFYVHEEYENWVEAARFDIQVIRYSLDYKEHGPRIQKLLEPFESVDITTAWPGRMEIVPKGVGKANALMRLCELYGIGRENLMAIGDGPNDVDMLKAAGFGVAMGNAVQPLLDIADAVTDGVNDEGFANALYRYVLNA